MLQKHWKLISLVALVCLALCIGAVATRQAMNGETEVSIDKVPAAVKAAFDAEAKGGTLGEIEIETENGRTVYEADVIIDGREVDIQVAPDGTLLGKKTEDDEGDDDDEGDNKDEDEEEVSLNDVPAAVKATILKEAAGTEIEEVVKETEDGQTVYEAEVIINGQETDIKVAADGTLLGKEVEDDNEEDDD
jgi:uncharacterized membrane protein YkoI